MKSIVFTLMLCVSGFNIGADDPGKMAIDLSHEFGPNSIYWPGMKAYSLVHTYRAFSKPGKWVENGNYESGEHGSTHIDAPRHFCELASCWSLDQIPIESTIADGVHIDVEDDCGSNSSYMLPLNKVHEWEENNGRIPDKAAVIIRFGWSKFWPDKKLYLGTDTEDEFSEDFYFPGVSIEAAKWLFENRDIKMLGSDCASVDVPKRGYFDIHYLLLPNNRLLLENLKIPKTLPARNFRVHASPTKAIGGSGIQTRIYAMLYDSPGSDASTCCLRYNILATLAILCFKFFFILLI